MPSELQKRDRQDDIPEIFDSRSVIKKLERLMDEVTYTEKTPETVNAACNCAGRIVDILRVHLEVQRIRGRRP